MSNLPLDLIKQELKEFLLNNSVMQILNSCYNCQGELVDAKTYKKLS